MVLRKDISFYLEVLKKVLVLFQVTENRRNVLLSVHKNCGRDCFDRVPSQEIFTSLKTDLYFVVQKFETALAQDTIVSLGELFLAKNLVASAQNLHEEFLKVYQSYNSKFCRQG